jgi:hypothetical protein
VKADYGGLTGGREKEEVMVTGRILRRKNTYGRGCKVREGYFQQALFRA